jgi:hypothetical protein
MRSFFEQDFFRLFTFYHFMLSVMFVHESNPAWLVAVAARHRLFSGFHQSVPLSQADGVF